MAMCSTWRGMGSARLYFAQDSPCNDNTQPYHTGTVIAWVNKDHTFCRTPGRRCQVCYWCIIEGSRKRQHHYQHLEHKEELQGNFRNLHTKWTGTDRTSLESVKWDERTLAKQQRKNTRFTLVEKKRINRSMALDFLFTRTSWTLSWDVARFAASSSATDWG